MNVQKFVMGRQLLWKCRKIPHSPGEVNSIVHLTIKQGEGRTMAADRVWNVGTCWDLRRSLAQWRQDISYLLINIIGCILFILSTMGQTKRRLHQYRLWKTCFPKLEKHKMAQFSLVWELPDVGTDALSSCNSRTLGRISKTCWW